MFSKLKIVAKLFNILSIYRGRCSGCKKNLSQNVLTNEEFNQLKNTFLSKVLIRDNIFLKTDPQELDNFVNFIEQNAPYDCVIDGLNVAYSSGVNKSPKVCATLVRISLLTFLFNF